MKRDLRDLSIVKEAISRLELNLSGLTVLTECASSSYSYTPIIALLAGAKKVIAVGKDSSFGTFLGNREKILQIKQRFDVEGELVFYENEPPSTVLKEVDIITNSRQLRPITSAVIKELKKSAVLPLMWETWEFRHADLDIHTCQQLGIPVIGTNEGFEKIKLFDYDGMLAIKLLFELGIEVHNNKIAILGGGIVGEHIVKTFSKLDINTYWFTPEGNERLMNCYSYKEIQRLLEVPHLDAIIFAELNYKNELVGRGNRLLSFQQVKEVYPAVRIGHISGNIDIDELTQSGIDFFPEQINPIGYISYGLENLGAKPVIELMAAGLKVGELAVRERINGSSVEKAITKTVEYGIGQDFEKGFNNFR